jgi:hypothetical protein
VLTGAEHGPDLDKLAVLMGKTEVGKRLAAAAAKLGFEL